MAGKKEDFDKKLGIQVTAINKLTLSIGQLTTVVRALEDEGFDLGGIIQKLGPRLGTTTEKFVELTKAADEFIEKQKDNKDLTSKQKESLEKFQKQVKSLGAAYNSLASRELSSLNKAQKENTSLIKEATDADAAAVKQSNQASGIRTKNFRQGLSDLRAIGQEENKRYTRQQKLLREEVSDLNQAEREKTSIRKRAFKELENRVNAEERLSDSLNTKNAALLRRLTKENEKAARAAEAAGEKQKFFGKAFRDAFSPQSIGKAIASVVKFISIYEILGTVISTVRQFFEGSIRAFIDFDEKISRVAAVTQASGEEIKSLSTSIRDVAIQTRFTANDVSELAISLGKLGVSAKDIPELLSPISVAAQATGEDLTSVGEAIIKVQNQFGLNAEQSANISAILTEAVNSTSLSLESFGTAIGYVGPLANQAGLSFDETAKALGILSDSGFSASRAGTGLRRILLDLKKPGVDLIDTLADLAAKNIGLEEAQELVGKQGAAQLLVLTQNISALKDVTLAEEGYANQLQATAIQMSSTSGQVEILASAYNELKISVGEFLVQNEILLKLISALDTQSGELARGYVLLRGESERLGDTFNARLAKGLRESSNSFKTLNDILKDSDDSGLRSIAKAIEAVNPKNIEDVNKELDRLQSRFEFLSNIPYFGNLFNTDDIEAYRGALNQVIEPQFKAAENNKFFEAGQRRVNEAYEEGTEAIGKIIDIEERKNAAIKKSSSFLRAANKLEAEATKLKEEDSKKNAKRINFLQGQANAYLQLRASLSAYTNPKDDPDAANKREKQILKEFNLRKKSFELELKLINDNQKDSKKAFDERIKQVNEEFDLRISKSRTEDEKIELLAQKRKREKEIIDEYSEELTVYADKTQDLTIRSGQFFDEYSKKLKNTEENTQLLANATEQWGQSLSNTVQANAEESIRTQITVVDEANRLYKDGTLIIDSWSESLEKLGNQFGNTTIDQLRLSVEQEKYVERIKGQIEGLESQYNQLFARLSSVVGVEQAKKLLEPISNALDFLRADLNDAIVKGTLTPKQIEELKKKVFFLKGELKDGIGEDDIIINIDITPAEILSQSLQTAADAISKFNDTALENTVNRLEAEKNAIQEQSDLEDEILRSKLDNQLISEAEYRAQVEKNRKKEITKVNALDKQIFQAEQKRDRQSALTDYLVAIASIIPNLIKGGDGDPITISLKGAVSAALATFAYGAEIRAINQRKFVPTKFAEGGLVNGPSHEQGGVPFTVRGQGGYEMEGGEYIVNKRATQKYKSVLDQINNYGKSNYKFAEGGIVKDPVAVANRQIELLEAIASSNVSLVGKLDKPVRAFVASDDLRSDSNALRIKERNSQL